MTDFIQEYFLNPLARHDDYAPYNSVNTIVFAVLALAAAYLIYRGLKRFGIKVDEKFFVSILPFIFLGSIVRVIVDAEILPRAIVLAGVAFYPFVTPGIYVMTFLVVVASIAAARFTKDFHKNLFAIGVFLSLLASLPLLHLFKEFTALALIIALALLALGLFALLWHYRRLRSSFCERAAVFSQSLDGAATFVGVSLLGYGEQHVVANSIFDFLGGPIAFYFIKIVFAFSVVELIRRDEMDGDKKVFVLLLITIFGLAPGVRDVLRILVGV